MSANGRVAAAAGDGVLERRLDLVERAGEDDRAAVDLGIEARLGGELGEPVDGDVDLDRARPGVPPLDVGDELGRQLVAVERAGGTRSSGGRW